MMGINRKYQIFVSSTYDDLIDERKEVVQAILECNCIPTGMELWPASSKTQWEVIKNVIDESDYYILIIGGKYGSETKNSSGKLIGYTEMEFDYAVEQKKPVIALVRENLDQIPVKFSEKSSLKHKKIENFRNKVCAHRMVSFWDTKENLKSVAITGIMKAKSDFPLGGWIRYNKPPTTDSTSEDGFSGKWKSYFQDTDGIEKSDSYDMNYDVSMNRLYGSVKRIIPKKNKEYTWECEGYVVGDNIVMVYWSLTGKTRLTCGSVYLRYAKHSEYNGEYITFDYNQKIIIHIPIKVVKL